MAILDIAKNDSQIESLQTRFQQSKILFLSVDVTDCTSVERTFSKISIEFTHIDILINAAGILNESDATQCVKVNLASFWIIVKIILSKNNNEIVNF